MLLPVFVHRTNFVLDLLTRYLKLSFISHFSGYPFAALHILLHYFLMPCFNFKVQQEKELFVLNFPPHDSKLSEIDYNYRSEEEQHGNNNFLQTFCYKMSKLKISAKVDKPKWRFHSQKICDAEIEVSAEAEVNIPLLLLRCLQTVSQCDRALRPTWVVWVARKCK